MKKYKLNSTHKKLIACFNIIETINNVIDTLEPSFKKRSISLIFDQTEKKVLKVFWKALEMMRLRRPW